MERYLVSLGHKEEVVRAERWKNTTYEDAKGSLCQFFIGQTIVAQYWMNNIQGWRRLEQWEYKMWEIGIPDGTKWLEEKSRT